MNRLSTLASQIEQPDVGVSIDRSVERDATAIWRERGIARNVAASGAAATPTVIAGPIKPDELSLAIGWTNPIDDGTRR